MFITDSKPLTMVMTTAPIWETKSKAVKVAKQRRMTPLRKELPMKEMRRRAAMTPKMPLGMAMAARKAETPTRQKGLMQMNLRETTTQMKLRPTNRKTTLRIDRETLRGRQARMTPMPIPID